MPLTISTAIRAGEIASNLIAVTNQLVKGANNIFNTGSPSTPDKPACSALDIETALGAVNTAQLKLILKAASSTDTGKLASALSSLS